MSTEQILGIVLAITVAATATFSTIATRALLILRKDIRKSSRRGK